MWRLRRRSIGLMVCVILLSTISPLPCTLDLEERFWKMTARTLFIDASFSPYMKETYPEHCKTTRPKYLQALETHLKTFDLSTSGPYIIGNNVTYADLVLYQVLHDENWTQEGRKGVKDYPRLVQVVDAVEGRPNVKAFLESERYLG